MSGGAVRPRLAVLAKSRATDHAIGISIGAVYVAWLLATARSLGFSRDEGFYFSASSTYAAWFRALFDHRPEALAQGFIDSHWSANHEHPALMKSLFALSWMFLHDRWRVFADDSTAFRFPGMVMAGIGLWVTFLFGTRVCSRRAGAVAAVLLGLMPNVFYHAHLACFDVPIMTMWAACIYVYWRAEQQGGVLWALAAGVMYGLTLETKHNAWVLPGVFVSHALVVHGRQVLRSLRAGLVALPATLVSMATVGPLVFCALWPWLWNDTAARVQGYLNFHLNHEYYNIEYLGVNYFGPPSPPSYAPMMILATVPTVTLILFGVGAYSRVAVGAARLSAWAKGLVGPFREAAARRVPTCPPRDPHATDLLLFLGFLVPISVFFLPKTPIFGGTKHWLPAYPFLAVFAGRGFDLVWRAMQQALSGARRAWCVAASAGLFASVALGPLLVTAHSHPFGLSAYVPLVGGTAGGADLGLNRQFWGFTTESLAPYFASNAAPGATVFFHDTAWDSWSRLLAEHRLRPDLRGVASPAEADFSIVHHELHMAEVEYNEWVTYGTDAPDYVLTHDGVPIISVYRRK